LLLPRNVISNQRRSVPPRLGAEIQLTPRRYNHAISCKLKHPKMQRKKAAAVGNGLQLNIFAQTLGIESFHHSAKHAHLHFSQAYLDKMAISSVL
jgi:hypothetical protein